MPKTPRPAPLLLSQPVPSNIFNSYNTTTISLTARQPDDRASLRLQSGTRPAGANSAPKLGLPLNVTLASSGINPATNQNYKFYSSTEERCAPTSAATRNPVSAPK